MSALSKTEEMLEQLSEEIRTSKLKNGEQLPSMRALAERFGCSSFVASQVIRQLEKLGLVQTRERSRSVVSFKEVHPLRRFALYTDIRQNTMEHYYDGLLDTSQQENFLATPVLSTPDCSNFQQVVLSLPHVLAIDLQAEGSDYRKLKENLSSVNSLFFNRFEWDEEELPSNGVLSDYSAMTLATLKYLHKQGHRRIVYIGHKREPLPFKRLSLEKAAKAAGIQFPSMEFDYCWYLDYAENRERYERIFFGKERPTAVIARSDALIFNLCVGLETLEPAYRDMARIGCHNTFWSRIPGFEFSTWQFDFHEMFRMAMSHEKPSLEYVMPKFIERERSQTTY